MRLRFGKHKGKQLCDVPESYLIWLTNASNELVLDIEDELDLPHEAFNGNGHGQSVPPNLPPGTRQILETGYRTLAKKYHADLNGGRPDERMTELNLVMEQLRKILK